MLFLERAIPSLSVNPIPRSYANIYGKICFVENENYSKWQIFFVFIYFPSINYAKQREFYTHKVTLLCNVHIKCVIPAGCALDDLTGQ